MNFTQAEGFCARLTELGQKDGTLPAGWEFRLPPEAQWEYACRAGTTTATAFGDKLSTTQANFRDRPYNGAAEGPSIGKATKVGRYPANARGLHDMHGNTFEWCRDWYHPTLPGGTDPDLSAAKATAPKNRDNSTSRVRRGVDGRGEVSAVGPPPAVRAGTRVRPHRLPGRAGQAVSRRCIHAGASPAGRRQQLRDRPAGR